MISRRDWLRLSVGSGAVLALDPRELSARVRHLLQQQPLMTSAIPSTGEKIPIIGLGSSATFSQVARSEDVSALKEVLRALVENGGTVFDTAPGYGASEEVASRVAREAGITEKIFWATKVNVARGGGSADQTIDARQVGRLGVALAETLSAGACFGRPTQPVERVDGHDFTLLTEYAAGELLCVLRRELEGAPRVAPERRLRLAHQP